MNISQALETLLARRPDALYVAALGTVTSALRTVSSDGPHLYFGGAMGSATPAALGIAERVAPRLVIAAVGDGELLLGARTLWSIAGAQPTNLLVVVMADGKYSMTGGQQITGAESAAGMVSELLANGVKKILVTTDDLDKYRGVSLERPPISDMARDPRQAPVYKAVKGYLEAIDDRLDEGEGLWLMGDVGTGKTTLAMLVSKAAVEAGRTVAIYSLPRLLSRVRRTYDAEAGEQSYGEFFERLTQVDLLHIDDLGAEKRSVWVLEQLYSIVNERYESQRSVVVTTNLRPPDLEEQIGPRTVSRLVEICGDPLPLFGDDMRYAV